MNEKKEEIPFFSINENSDTFLIRPLLTTISPQTFSEVPHRHNYQEIIYVQAGKGRHLIDDEIIPITAHTCYLIQEGQIHQFIEGSNLKGYIIRFKREFFADVSLEALTPYDQYSGTLIPIVIALDSASRSDLDSFFESINREYNLPEGTFKKRNILQHLTSIVVSRLQRIQRNSDLALARSSDDTEKKLFLEFNHLLDSNFSTHHQVGFYAKKVGVRNRVLSNIVKNHTGHTAKKFIIIKLVTEAKRKLRFTNMNLKEVTYFLGLDNPAYFSRMFKEQTGLSPKTYQQSKKVLL